MPCWLILLLLLLSDWNCMEGGLISNSGETCGWSGKSFGCGNGVCPGTDWYAIGSSSNDEDGNPCADGINDLNCCPKERRPRTFKVKVCTGTNLQGDCPVIQSTIIRPKKSNYGFGGGIVLSNSTTECFELPANVKGRVNSVDTYGGCVRLYYGTYCNGPSVALYKGNSNLHKGLTKYIYAKGAGSVGPCLRNDFCSPQNSCHFPVEIFRVGCCRETTESKDTSGGPVDSYNLYGDRRTEYLLANIELHHLNTGKQPTTNSLEHVRSLGLPTDVNGMLLPARLGGDGTDPRNLFPLTPDLNIQAVLKTYEDYIYDLFRKHGKVELRVTLDYKTDTDTRPIQVLFTASLSQSQILLFQDSIGNPEFPISGTRSVMNYVAGAATSSNTFLHSFLGTIGGIIIIIIIGLVILFVHRRKGKRTAAAMNHNNQGTEEPAVESVPLMNDRGISDAHVVHVVGGTLKTPQEAAAYPNKRDNLNRNVLPEPPSLKLIASSKNENGTNPPIPSDDTIVDIDSHCYQHLGGGDEAIRPPGTTTTTTGKTSLYGRKSTQTRRARARGATLLSSENNIVAIAVKLSTFKAVCEEWTLLLPYMNLADREADLTNIFKNNTRRTFFRELLNMWKSVSEPEECTIQRLQFILNELGYKEAAASIENL